MHKETPLDSDRSKFILRYKKGGLKSFEPELLTRMRDININQPEVTDPLTGDLLQWKYVGDSWWCRKRVKKLIDQGKKKPKIVKAVSYEFGRFVAIINDKSKTQVIHGLWNAPIHHQRDASIVVTYNEKKGVICGRSSREVFIRFDDITLPFRKIDDLQFEYIEDYEEYQKIFKGLK